VEECATLLNIDANNKDLMDMVYDTAFAIKNRIYGNRIVLFAPLYIANYCVNSCTYCAFRAGNKGLQVCVFSLSQRMEGLQGFGQQRQQHVLQQHVPHGSS
jgi:2-iminoacetate synthase ThiH